MGQPFKPHPNLSDEINDNISRSETEGGAYLNNLAVGKRLYVTTQSRVYTIEHREDGFYIWGHPKYCPEPILASIAGSTWGGSMLKMNFVGIGMHLEFRPSTSDSTVTTTEIQDVKEG
jgi:hypothetical protein